MSLARHMTRLDFWVSNKFFIIFLSQERDSGIPCAQSQDSTNVDGGDISRDKTREEENLDCPYYMFLHIILRYSYVNYCHCTLKFIHISNDYYGFEEFLNG